MKMGGIIFLLGAGREVKLLYCLEVLRVISDMKVAKHQEHTFSRIPEGESGTRSCGSSKYLGPEAENKTRYRSERQARNQD